MPYYMAYLTPSCTSFKWYRMPLPVWFRDSPSTATLRQHCMTFTGCQWSKELCIKFYSPFTKPSITLPPYTLLSFWQWSQNPHVLCAQMEKTSWWYQEHKLSDMGTEISKMFDQFSGMCYLMRW